MSKTRAKRPRFTAKQHATALSLIAVVNKDVAVVEELFVEAPLPAKEALGAINKNLATLLVLITTLGLIKDSSNGHQAPSKDLARRRGRLKKNGRKPGGQKGHEGYTHELDPHPDVVVYLSLEDEEVYEADPDWERLEPETRQVKDIKITTLTTNYYQFSKMLEFWLSVHG
jgi:hypothetical protein